MGWGVHDYPGPPPEEPMPICPVCGWETDTLIRDKYGEFVGCDNCGCLDCLDAWDYAEDGKEPVCPVCGKVTDTLYRSKDGQIVGCDNIGCLQWVDAWDYVDDL